MVDQMEPTVPDPLARCAFHLHQLQPGSVVDAQGTCDWRSTRVNSGSFAETCQDVAASVADGAGVGRYNR